MSYVVPMLMVDKADEQCSARIPQIAKNYREKSCDGLALLFFLLSLMGNITYGAGVSKLKRGFVAHL